MRFGLNLSYDGTDYSGWQRQLNTDSTIQQVIEDSLSKVLNHKIEVVGCGRTDTGVHAKNYIAHFEYFDAISKPLELVHTLNKMVGSGIVIHTVFSVDPNFHARFDALSRSYEYRISVVKNPFNRHFSYYYPYKKALDIDYLNEWSEKFVGKYDFESFCKIGSDVNNTFCEVTHSYWKKEEEEYVFNISANRFLRGMIRLVVGAFLNLERGKLTEDQFLRALYEKEKLDINWSVPAKGLILKEIVYKKNHQSIHNKM